MQRAFSDASRRLLGLFAVEAGALVTLFGLYKAGDVRSLFTTKFAVLAITGVGLIALGIARVLQHPVPRRAFGIAVVANVVSVALAVGAAEIALRALARTTMEGTTIGNVAIRPTWSELVEQVRTMPPSDQTFFTYDAELGWTVGPNRHGGDGLYYSSVEGIRSAKPDVSYAAETPKYRVALIGDSNAFSLEVSFEDSWGYQLGRVLGSEVQVLNFGVDGYGIDQIYLRYLRDVRPWHPRVVVVGFIQHDLMRSMAVYPFVSLGWPRYLTKPRFDLSDGGMVIVNRPLPTPAEIARATAPADLPFIAYDPGFVDQEWEWRFDRGPVLLRFVTSLSPRWPHTPPLGRADTQALNSRLLNELVGAIERDGARPMLVYLPHWIGSDELALSTLQRSGLPYRNMTECLTDVPADQRRVPSGGHYTGIANTALAECVAPEVRCGLAASTCDVQPGH